MFGRRGDGMRCALLAALAAVCACNAYQPYSGRVIPEQPDGGRDSDAAIATDAAVDAGPVREDAGDAEVAADGGVQAGCEPNPDAGDAGCAQLCPEACNGLDDDCDGLTDESSDVDRSCTAPHSMSVCSAGRCVVTQCLGGYRDCDGMPANGCEVAQDSPEHCGACHQACRIENATAACEAGACVVGSCGAGFADCDEDGLTCETRTNTLLSCGGCGVPCDDVPNAVPSCDSGSCGVGACKAGYGDCDGLAANGCEQTLDTLAHCGACETPCAKASCGGGVCSAADCSVVPGSADCDRDEASCEIDLRSDVDNCGACGNVCKFNAGVTPHATLSCSTSGCLANCEAGFGDCDGNYANGCEQPLSTLSHCGACRAACSIAHATATCSTGSCRVASCTADWADCNGDQTSCETALNAPDHCGSCTTVCNLPNAIEGCGGSAGNRSCTVAGCEGSWVDCDTSAANGCERDARTPATGGLGPCLPDNACVKSTSGGREYFVCPTARTWTDARSRCQLQARGDLAQLADSTENTFVRDRIGSTVWIGHTDTAHEGTWVWAHNQVPFWQSGEGTLAGQYANWAAGEPNASGNCGALYTSGQFDDAVCSAALPFVCEVIPDACPSDATKIDPGQCGCGMPDTDTDADAYANCNDMCPNSAIKRAPGVCGCDVADTNTDGDSLLDCQETCDTDPNKTSAGACGCGNPDTNADGDSLLDCQETCDTDPNKLAPGACGCGTPDTDSDLDGTANCNDQCPLDNSTAGPCFGFTHTNFKTATLNFTPSPTTTLNCGNATINTSANPVAFTNWCGGAPAYEVQTQTNGPDIIVIPLKGLTIAAGVTLRLLGTRPVVFAVRGSVVVNGIIDANASSNTPGAGGNFTCGGSAGGNGSGSASFGDGGGGGGGGGFGTAGGRGGQGDNSNNYGAGGVTRNDANIRPLYGGCPGGNGGGCSSVGGAGGGAVQITASGNIDINGTIRANGGNGAGGCGTQGGGAGGGSGGAILLESSTRDTAGSTITANGGAGGNGTGLSSGNGGNGSTGSGIGGQGQDENGAGGGGGGGAGRIKR